MIFFSPAGSRWVEKLPTQSMAALKINQSLRIGLGRVIEFESFFKPNKKKTFIKLFKLVIQSIITIYTI